MPLRFPLIFALALAASLGAAAPAAADCRFTLHFGFASAALTRADRQLLDEIARTYPAAPIALSSHADDDGSHAGNMRLAEARARSVVERLRAAGHRRDASVRILPLAATWDAVPSQASAALNRRVDLLVGGCDPRRHVLARPARTPGVALVPGGGVRLTAPALR
jgi:hypothetical protein